ncbi:helix-turn-helix domain-containing protein [Domibacillus tundrae]|uniref:helix-turn-helix domain-containing protein n=1 Tax=Domibacillus tundrae TaxID=1587527 RepID=UPI00069782A3|nr:helix-turn-helix transcriptional regulator [Domibacillus tundrae]
MRVKDETKRPLVVKIDEFAVEKKLSKEEAQFIQTLIHERKKRRITQEELAEMVGCNQAVIGRLEAMKVSPTLKTIIKLLGAMDLKLIIVDKE